MNFADIGGVPAVMGGSDSSGMMALLATLMRKDDDKGEEWMAMMFLFIVFVIIIIVIIALIWSKRERPESALPYAAAMIPPVVNGYGYDKEQSHREHWDQIRDTHKMEIVNLKGQFDLSRQADFNHYTAAMQSEKHNFETNKNIDALRAENERQTLLLMREMDQKEAANLRERLLKEELEKSNLLQTSAIIHALAPKPPVAVNQVWGQVPMPAAVGAFPVGCGGFAPA